MPEQSKVYIEPMRDEYSPISTYSFAMCYVNLYNNFYSGKQHTPFNLAEMFGYISDYLRHRDHFCYEKITFHAYLFLKTSKRRQSPLLATEPHNGLIEIRIISFDKVLKVMFPADLNSGWQSVEFKKRMEKDTIFHGYVKDRGEAVRLLDFMRELQVIERRM